MTDPADSGHESGAYSPPFRAQNDSEDDHAVRAGLADDVDAGFVALMGTHGRLLYSVALSVSGRPADAEDLAAEAFLRAYRALRGFDGARIAALRPRAWLVTILLNTWRNGRRDAQRRPQEVPLEQAVEPRQSGPGLDERAVLDERQRELVAMIRTLPHPQRVAVVLRHVVGLPIIEIAGILGCPEGTAKSHISRALQGLRRLDERSESP